MRAGGARARCGRLRRRRRARAAGRRRRGRAGPRRRPRSRLRAGRARPHGRAGRPEEGRRRRRAPGAGSSCALLRPRELGCARASSSASADPVYHGGVPELPEVEITARRLDEALRGATIESALAPGINALKTFDPPLHALEGGRSPGVRRIGKHLVVDVERRARRAGAPDVRRAAAALRQARVAARPHVAAAAADSTDGRELRLREFGTQAAAWVKVLRAADVEADDALASLGPGGLARPACRPAALLAPHGARPLHAVLRDQRVIAGIGRSWVDEILWTARLSPFKRGDDLDESEARALREAIIERLGGALDALRAGRPPADPRQAAAAAAGPSPPGRALPALRHDARGRALRGLRHVATARPSRPAVACSRTAGCRGC